MVDMQIVPVEHFTLPDRVETQRRIDAIRAFQMACRQHLVDGHDYGTIPGTGKPTLLKPGAEKIVRLLGLADEYEIMEQTKDWDRPFFEFQIKCRLTQIGSGLTINNGVGECNSMESKYRWRWVFRSELDKLGMPQQGLPIRIINTKNGQTTQYRIDNEDIYSQVNTILKMAKKRALVDAALSAGRLSEIFTQDLEDMADVIQQETPQVRARPVAQERQRQAPSPGERPQRRQVETGEILEPDDPPKKPDYQVFYEAARAKGYTPPQEALAKVLNVKDWNDWAKMGGDLPTALKRLEKMEAKE